MKEITHGACWSIVVRKQNSGAYLEDKACNAFSVNFGDYTLDLQTQNINLNYSIRDYFSNAVNGTTTEMIYASFSGVYRIGTIEGGALDIEDQRAVYYKKVPGYEHWR